MIDLYSIEMSEDQLLKSSSLLKSQNILITVAMTTV